MKIFITGGSGYVGRLLSIKLIDQGHGVTVLTRSTRKKEDAGPSLQYCIGDPNKEGEWQDVLAEHDVVVNLAGSSIFKYWTNSIKDEIVRSRIETTKHVVQALAKSNNKDIALINASAVGYYGFHNDTIITESKEPGKDFLAQLCNDWEQEALKAEGHGARVVLCRIGVVMGKKSTSFSMLSMLARFCLASPLGNGKQYVSWVHEKDLIEIINKCIIDNSISGPVNCVAPEPVTNREMVKKLGRALKKPQLFPPVPGFGVKLLMGELGNVLLKGQRVAPRKILDHGYEFSFINLDEAYKDLVNH